MEVLSNLYNDNIPSPYKGSELATKLGRVGHATLQTSALAFIGFTPTGVLYPGFNPVGFTSFWILNFDPDFAWIILTIRRVADQGMQRAEVMIKGPGLGREAALRAIRRSGSISKGVANGSAGSPIIDGSRTANPTLQAIVPKITTGNIYKRSLGHAATLVAISISGLLVSFTGYALYTAFGQPSQQLRDPFEEHGD
ncbi:hypothetical protein VNO77_39130 [Canavalia gladiata]|uniref:Transmembrane protein n=16 Tax=Mesangiospermae TaxID=1437183 RepID=A0AAN9PVK0_CANGL